LGDWRWNKRKHNHAEKNVLQMTRQFTVMISVVSATAIDKYFFALKNIFLHRPDQRPCGTLNICDATASFVIVDALLH
jgi:hypothetical protein